MRLAAPIFLAAAAAARDTFHESLTLHPLPDGKLSVLFEFTTQFDLHHGGESATRRSTVGAADSRPEPPRAYPAGAALAAGAQQRL